MKKRILSILMALCMAICMIPIAASAMEIYIDLTVVGAAVFVKKKRIISE